MLGDTEIGSLVTAGQFFSERNVHFIILDILLFYSVILQNPILIVRA